MVLLVLIGVDAPWRGVIPACLSYLTRSPPENSHTTARHVYDACLWEHRLAQAQNVLYAHNIVSDERVNRSDDDWDDLQDNRLINKLCVKFPLVVLVATFGSLIGSHSASTNFSESLNASTCLSESFI